MTESLWVLEYRTRERKNGKWSEWAPDGAAYRPATAFKEYPSDQVFAHERYERRAVEYVRKGVSE